MRRLWFPALGLALGLGLLLAVSAAPAADKDAPVVPPRQGKSETIKLFDGKTLDGWEGDKDLWSVKDGEIVGKSKGRSAPAPTCSPRRRSPTSAFSYGQAGRVGDAHGDLLLGQTGAGEGRRVSKAPEKAIPTPTPAIWSCSRPAGACGPVRPRGRPGRGRRAGQEGREGKQHDWNQLEILAQGNRVRVAANGVPIIDWRDPKPDRIKEAPIGLQLHSNKDPEEVRFKDITVTTFPPEDKLPDGQGRGKRWAEPGRVASWRARLRQCPEFLSRTHLPAHHATRLALTPPKAAGRVLCVTNEFAREPRHGRPTSGPHAGSDPDLMERTCQYQLLTARAGLAAGCLAGLGSLLFLFLDARQPGRISAPSGRWSSSVRCWRP